MRLYYKPLDILMDFDEHHVIELVIEDRDYFAKVIFDLYDSFETNEGLWIGSLDGKPVALDKNTYAISDYYFMLNPSKSRTVSTALLKLICAQAQSAEHLEKGIELATAVEDYGLALVDELGFDFEVSTDGTFDVVALVKALGLQIFLTSDSLVSRTVEICDVLQTLTGINHFIMINAPSFMGATTMASLIDELTYHDHRVLLLSINQASCKMPLQIIVDENLAVL